MNVHYSTFLEQMAFEGAKNITWEVWSSPYSIIKTYSAEDNVLILSSEEQSIYSWQEVDI